MRPHSIADGADCMEIAQRGGESNLLPKRAQLPGLIVGQVGRANSATAAAPLDAPPITIVVNTYVPGMLTGELPTRQGVLQAVEDQRKCLSLVVTRKTDRYRSEVACCAGLNPEDRARQMLQTEVRETANGARASLPEHVQRSCRPPRVDSERLQPTG
jgi:hypothetical protein